MAMRWSVGLTALLGVMLSARGSSAIVIDDGILALDAGGERYSKITLNGSPFNQSTFVQAFFIDDSERTTLVQSSTSTMTVHAGGCSECTQVITTELVGPLVGLPGSGLLRQTVAITRNAGTSTPRDYTLHSYYQSRLNNSAGDTGDFDPTTGAVYSVDASLLFAMVAASSGGEIPKWGVAEFGPTLDEFAALTNSGGPLVGQVLTELGMGFAFSLQPGETKTFEFLQLHAAGIQSVPTQFAIPEPSVALAQLVGLLALGWLRRNRS